MKKFKPFFLNEPKGCPDFVYEADIEIATKGKKPNIIINFRC
jgi:hypothetical protein